MLSFYEKNWVAAYSPIAAILGLMLSLYSVYVIVPHTLLLSL